MGVFWAEVRIDRRRLAQDSKSELVSVAKEVDLASRHIAKIRSTFALLEPGGSVVRKSDLIGRGDSKSDRARARRNALNDLRRSLAGFAVLDGLIDP